jgi:Cu(I)/Ag(I) efflux system membrane protein CusA/SilA
MIGRIIEFSARNRAIVILLAGFAVAAGVWSLRRCRSMPSPIWATQVIIYSRWDRARHHGGPGHVSHRDPMLGALPSDRRGFSISAIHTYLIFDEGTDIYWARSRTLEYPRRFCRNSRRVQTENSRTQPVLVGYINTRWSIPRGRSLAELRSYQDWYLQYYLKSVPGVAEVAPLGGFVRQYQVQVDPNRLRAFNMPIAKVIEAVRSGNNDVGVRLVEITGAEYMVRGRGYARSPADLENIVLSSSAGGVPVRVKDVGRAVLGPDLRRGIADWNGQGDAVTGIVVMRQGANALDVIDRVKAKLHELEPGLPTGVKIVSAYDRSELILRSIENLKSTLIEEMTIVAIVIFVFLWHIPSAIIPVVTIPIAVLIAFIPMRAMGLSSNIMSLGGIAIAIGALVDASIVVAEQTHKKLEEWERNGRGGDYRRVIVEAVKEVGGPAFFALLVIAVSFLPVLTLEAQEGRLFKPLAYTKNLSMLVAAMLAITLDPAMRRC